MKITDILVKDAIILELASETKNDVLAEMARALAKAEQSLDAGFALRVLTARETMQSMRKEAQKLEKETRGKLESILSAEQLDDYDKFVAEKREERRSRMQGRGGGGS